MSEWMSQVIDLFNRTLSAILEVPVLRLFLGVLLFLTVISLLMYFFHQGRKACK